MAQAEGPDGGIGRRAWFRSMCLRVWRFESSSGHQKSKTPDNDYLTISWLVIDISFRPECCRVVAESDLLVDFSHI